MHKYAQNSKKKNIPVTYRKAGNRQQKPKQRGKKQEMRHELEPCGNLA